MTFRADWHSLQVRFWFILGCAVLPLLLIFLWDFRSEYQHQVKMAESRVLQVLNVSKRFEQVALEQASLILGIMSKANELDTLDPEACNGLAQRLQRSSPQLANLGAVHANGVVFCSAQPAPSPVNVSDRVWFKEALALDSQRLTSGEFVIGRISRQPGIVFGYPLKRDGAAADLMLFASMHMDFFRPVVESLPDEPGWQIQILRRDGSVLMSHPPAAPDVVAHASTTFTLDAALLSRLTNGQTIHQSPDRQGNLRLVGLKTMDVASNELVLSVTAPLHLSINRLRAALAWELAGLLALLLFSVGLARWQIYGLVEDWTARIQKVLRQIGQGQLDASMSPASTIRELADVEQGLAHMTNKLRAKHDENLRLLQAIEQSPVSVVITDPSGKIEYVNRKFVEISGYSKDEVLGKNPKILNHGITPRPVYETLWATLTRGEVWIGEFINTRKDGSTYTELATIAPVHDEQGQLSHYIAVKEDISEQKTNEARLDRLNNYDLLTDLPNRRLLGDRIEQAALSADRSHQWAMLLVLDLDRFKLLNDSYGHEAGDCLLQTVAHRIREVVREEDTVARRGDDEFAVLIENLDVDPLLAGQMARQIAYKIQGHLSQPLSIPLRLNDYRTSLTIGITLFNGSGLSADELLRQAEIALISGKDAGGHVIRFHDPRVEASLRQRADLEQAMRLAIEEEAFVLHYQPQVDRNGRVVGAEALIRWMRADGSMESPANFIPIAESTGLILPIGQWVMDMALKQLRTWAMQPQTQHLDLSVNISATQFRHPDFVKTVQDGLLREQVSPQRLILELTESVVLEDVDFVVQRMEALRQLGVRFALDDFGTGYSSLAYLKRLPLQQIKIDQGFVRDMLTDTSSQAIVKAVLALSQAMGLDVVAEGVETPAQRDFLLLNGCTQLQGYLLGRPVPIKAFPT